MVGSSELGIAYYGKCVPYPSLTPTVTGVKELPIVGSLGDRQPQNCTPTSAGAQRSPTAELHPEAGVQQSCTRVAREGWGIARGRGCLARAVRGPARVGDVRRSREAPASCIRWK